MEHRLPPAIRARVADAEERVIVTGAGGWLGMATLDLLHETIGAEFSRRVIAFGSDRRQLRLRNGTPIEQRPLTTLRELDNAPSVLLHLAFLTKDRAEDMAEAEYRAANRALSAQVLDAAEAIGVSALFVASSGAGLHADDPDASPAMQLYGELKRADEEAFGAWSARTGRAAVIARIFNVAGPYINKHRTYALAAFIVDALAGRAVTVKAVRPVWRSYVALRELFSLVLALLFDPAKPLVRFDTAGEETLEMRVIAARVAALVGDGRVEATPADPTLSADNYVGERKAYAALLAARGIESVSFDRQVLETAAYIASAPR